MPMCTSERGDRRFAVLANFNGDRYVLAKFWGKSDVADQGSQHVANSKQTRDSQSLGIACGGFLGASRASFFRSLHGLCAGGEADQTDREAYAGLHRRVRRRGATLRW